MKVVDISKNRGKSTVQALAKELGVPTKMLLSKLKELGIKKLKSTSIVTVAERNFALGYLKNNFRDYIDSRPEKPRLTKSKVRTVAVKSKKKEPMSHRQVSSRMEKLHSIVKNYVSGKNDPDGEELSVILKGISPNDLIATLRQFDDLAEYRNTKDFTVWPLRNALFSAGYKIAISRSGQFEYDGPSALSNINSIDAAFAAISMLNQDKIEELVGYYPTFAQALKLSLERAYFNFNNAD